MSRSIMPFPILSKSCEVVELSARRTARWQPGCRQDRTFSTHSEIFGSSAEASGAGAALALALDDDAHHRLNAATIGALAGADRRAVLWVQTREAARLNGRPYRAGLPAELRQRVIHVCAAKAEDALFALEEGLRCRDVAFVLGEVTGNPRALDFVASRRLSLLAERHGVPLYLVRLDAARDLSSARMRWDVSSAASAPPAWNGGAPGAAAWRAELFRARSHASGEWVLGRDSEGRLSSDPVARLAFVPKLAHAANS